MLHIPEVVADDFVLLATQASHLDELDPIRDLHDADTYENGIVTFNNVNIESGDYVTLGIHERPDVSLGGVLTDLRLWLDADDPITLHPNSDCTGTVSDGDRVRCWQDKSGFHYDVTEISGDCVVCLLYTSPSPRD